MSVLPLPAGQIPTWRRSNRSATAAVPVFPVFPLFYAARGCLSVHSGEHRPV